MSLDEFIKQYYPWLINLCQTHHSKFGEPIGLSIEDMLQETVLMLPDILVKYGEYKNSHNGKSCSITTFVWNRIRGRFQSRAETEFRKMKAELEYGVEDIENRTVIYDEGGELDLTI